MQCLSFCLFGVYGVDDEKRIQVQNQDNCKTNCPACSRVCPEAAIMFPKYKAGPINGDFVSDSDLNREKMKIDISALLGGDVYSMLRNRSQRAQSRFSKERDADKALAERQKCLVKLGSDLNEIPPEVLMSLPSPEEIARIAGHERGHLQSRDNVKRWIMSSLPDLLRWTPVHREIIEAWHHAAEDAADDASTGKDAVARAELAALLLKVARLAPHPLWQSAIVSPFVERDGLERRVRRLIQPDLEPPAPLAIVPLITAAVMIAATLAALSSPKTMELIFDAFESLVALGR
jgi:NAD-dependent dihydropyrimidine dehydrogenase PreA subunit